MTGTKQLAALKQLVSHIAQELEADSSDAVLNSDDLYGMLGRSGGNVELLHADRPMIAHDGAAEILDRAPDRPPVYGIDAGLTTPLEVVSDEGVHVINLASAACGAVGADIGAVPTMAMTNVGVVASPDDTPRMSPTNVLDGAVEARIEVVTDSLRLSQPEKLTTDYARGLAEGRHLRRIAQHADGIVVLDGPVLPSSSIIKDLVFKRIHDDSSVDPWKSVPGRAMRDYVRGFETLFDGGHPVIGVVKSGVSSRLLNAIAEKTVDGTPIPWTRDVAFLDQLLRSDEEEGIYRYTPWFIEPTYRTDVGSGHELSLVGGLDSEYRPEVYRRAFFYVRSPNVGGTGTIMRVESLAGVVEDPDRAQELQDLVLAEFARTGDVPEPILRADQRVRIPRTKRIKIAEEAGLATVRNYDRDHRGYAGDSVGGDRV